MFCRHCRIQVPDGVTFCPVCGRELKESMPLLKECVACLGIGMKSLEKRFQIKNKKYRKRPAKRNYLFLCRLRMEKKAKFIILYLHPVYKLKYQIFDSPVQSREY